MAFQHVQALCSSTKFHNVNRFVLSLINFNISIFSVVFFRFFSVSKQMIQDFLLARTLVQYYQNKLYCSNRICILKLRECKNIKYIALQNIKLLISNPIIANFKYIISFEIYWLTLMQ